MKTLVPLFAVVALFVLGACRKAPVANHPPDAQAPVATPDALPSASLPDAQAAPAAAGTSHGVFFLRAAASVQTASGLVTFQPGTRLQQAGPNSYTARGQTLTLRDDQVTDYFKPARQTSASDSAAQIDTRRERKEPSPDLAPITPEVAREISTDPQYKALSERADVVRSKIERVSREASRLSNNDAKTAPAASALKKEREKLEGELQAITEQQNLLRKSK